MQQCVILRLKQVKMSKIMQRLRTTTGFLEKGTSQPYWAMETCQQNEVLMNL